MASETVTSADGTEIAFERIGDGPPIVCLHGTGVTGDIWLGLAEAVGADAELIVPDRRGRGDSPDTSDDEYDVDREIEDVRALVEAVGTETTPLLFGSSFGGLLAMMAADRMDIAGLILYEPPMPAVTVDEMAGGGLARRLERRLDAGEPEGVVREFFSTAVGLDDVELLPVWPDCVDFAETFVREASVVESFDPADLTISVPTLLLSGTSSPDYLRDGVGVLESVIPETTRVDIAGAGHAGIVTAPEQVAEAVVAFLDGAAD